MYKSGIPVGLAIESPFGKGVLVYVYGSHGDFIASEYISDVKNERVENGITRIVEGINRTEKSNEYFREYIDDKLVSEKNHNGRLFRSFPIKQQGEFVHGLLDGVVTCEGKYEDLTSEVISKDMATIDAILMTRKLKNRDSDVIKTIMTYSRGMLHGEVKIFVNGHLSETRNYFNNVRDGKVVKTSRKRNRTYHMEGGLLYNTTTRLHPDEAFGGMTEESIQRVGNKEHGASVYAAYGYSKVNYYFGLHHGESSSGMQYKYGRKHGLCVNVTHENITTKKNYREGLLHYKRGKLTGNYRSWHPNGKICEKSYLENGERVGPYTLYDEKGNIAECSNRTKSARSA
jgi:antitoxin component YwqK of YwqJK toxin-antitoxin module